MSNESTVHTVDDSLAIDLSDLAIEDIELFTQESSRGIPDFAASSSGTCSASGCNFSCQADAAL